MNQNPRRIFIFPSSNRVSDSKIGWLLVLDEAVKTFDDLRERILQRNGSDRHLSQILLRTSEGNCVDFNNDLEVLRDGDSLVAVFSLEQECENWVRLNVGGQNFVVSRSLIQYNAPDSMLSKMANLYSGHPSGIQAGTVDESGAVIIDRSPKYFEFVVNYLRTGKLILDHNTNPEGVLEEAKFYGIDALIEPLQAMISERDQDLNYKPLTRNDVVRILAATPCSRDLRFQGVNLAGADLSKLDLRSINFKYANLRGCNFTQANLSFSNLERADLSGSVLDGAQMLGVKMLCANLERASLQGCNLDDPAGSNAVLEGVNLKDAVMEGSNMARVNLRVATIKRGNLRNCDLRAAVLAGADLELCDLSGSDLCEANLRGANLKDTLLELMQTPLHMSQTIR